MLLIFSQLCFVSTSFGYFFILKKNARTMQNQHRVEHFKITNEKPTLS